MILADIKETDERHNQIISFPAASGLGTFIRSITSYIDEAGNYIKLSSTSLDLVPETTVTPVDGWEWNFVSQQTTQDVDIKVETVYNIQLSNGNYLYRALTEYRDANSNFIKLATENMKYSGTLLEGPTVQQVVNMIATLSPVKSVNGQTEVVVLDTDDVAEGTTNLYYTDPRVQAVINAYKDVPGGFPVLDSNNHLDIANFPEITASFIDYAPATPGNWPTVPANVQDALDIIAMQEAASVTSVFGREGDVVAQTGDYTQAQVGLGNVDNTSDANKPVSTAQQAALDLKAPLASPTFTGNPTAPTPSTTSNSTRIATTAFVQSQNYITSAGAPVQSVAGRTGDVVLNKEDVGLANVDNTSDINKPVSNATQTALNGKEPTIAAGDATQYWRGDKTFQTLNKTAVGLGNVDNTSDSIKPVSGPQQTALNAKQNTITGAATSITDNDLFVSRALVSDGSGKVAVATTTATEIGFVAGVTSSIQTQLNAKQPTIGYTPENVANKATSLSAPDNTKYPTTAAVATAIATVVAEIPTKTSQLTNDAGFITSDPTQIAQDATHRFATDAEISTWNGKQDALGYTPVPNTTTVNGHPLSSNVTVTQGDVGLGNVNNTSDANKPVSTAQQTALNLKENLSNKATDLTSPDNTKYPTTAAVANGLALKQNVIPYTTENVANKGAANGYASLDANGLVPFSELPVTVKDVHEYANTAAFPAVGMQELIYVALDTKMIYRFNATSGLYEVLSPTPATTDGLAEGSVNLYYLDSRAQASVTGAASTVVTSNLTGNKALVSTGTGKIGISATSSTEIGYVAGVTSAIQTQLNTKAPTASPSFTGNPTAPTPATNDNSTSVATTAFVDGAITTAVSTIDHGTLLGLGDDDHTQYLLVNGSRPMSGDLSVGGHNITNVGTVDGVDVTAHASRHLPAGADPLATAAPIANLTAASTNGVGSAQSFARSDHSHAITTGTPGTLIPNQANATGTATGLARADHVHNIETAAVISQTPDQTNAEGTTANFARADHIHNIPTDVAVGLSASTTNTQGVAPTFGRSDHTHAIATSAPAAQLADQTNAAGTSANLARADHVHNIATAVPVAVDATANAQGTATTFSKSDHKHTIATAAPVTQIPAQTNAIGTSSSMARADHIHNIPIAAPIADLNPASTNSAGAASTFALSDHSHAIDTGVAANISTIVPNAAAAAGTQSSYPRTDHTHAIAVDVAVTQTPAQTNAAGTSNSFARADHIHNIPVGTPVTVSTANSAGTAATFVRSDHTHDHGAQTTATHHAVATSSANGFMSSTDKAKLDKIGGQRIIKSGTLATTSFTGSPLKALVTFATVFPNTNYQFMVMGGDGRIWTYENQAADEISINTNSASALTAPVFWMAISTGESIE